MFHRRAKNSRRARSAFFSSQHRPSLTRSERLRFEELEARTMLDATPMISEFLAANSNGIKRRGRRQQRLDRDLQSRLLGRQFAGVAPD